MGLKHGDWSAVWEAGASRAIDGARTVGRAALDLILPPPLDAGHPAALSADDWSRIIFLEAPVCDGCGAAFEADGGAFSSPRCAACLTQPYRFARARAACVYDEASRGLLLRFKHGDHQPLASLFARWIARAAADLTAEADAVAPVPLHPLRLLSRRFNQAAEIARPLARASGLEYLPDALVRARRTDTQGGKSARGRRLNVRAAFSVTTAGSRRIKGRRILLVDDVLTTGATGEACARALLDAGARAVDLAVVARVRTARALTT